MRKSALSCSAACIAGGGIVATLVTVARALAPEFGVGLRLWAPLLCAALASLAAGSLLGARAIPVRARLGLPLLGAGIWLLALPWLVPSTLHIVQALPDLAGGAIAATVLPGPALLLLGMVQPLALRGGATPPEALGRAAATLHACSLLAGVLALPMTGFWLLPWLGVHRTLLAVGSLLALTGALALLASRRHRARSQTDTGAGIAACLAVCAAAASPFMPAPAESRDPQQELLARLQSPEAEIRVLAGPLGLELRVDGVALGRVVPDTWLALDRPAAALSFCKNLFARSGRLLVLGLGNGAIARGFASEGWSVQAADADAALVDVVRRHFGGSLPGLQLAGMEPRRFLRTRGDRYDLIVIDTRARGTIPFHLLTRDAFQLAAEHLTQDGIVAVCLQGIGWEDALLRNVAATLRVSFHTVTALPLHEPPDVLGQVALLASNRDLDFHEERLPDPAALLGDDDAHWIAMQTSHAWLNRYEPASRGARVQTDDRTSADLRMDVIDLAARRQQRARAGRLED